MNKVTYELNKLNRKNKEDLLQYLFNLEKQGTQSNQELVSSFPQKDD